MYQAPPPVKEKPKGWLLPKEHAAAAPSGVDGDGGDASDFEGDADEEQDGAEESAGEADEWGKGVEEEDSGEGEDGKEAGVEEVGWEEAGGEEENGEGAGVEEDESEEASAKEDGEDAGAPGHGAPRGTPPPCRVHVRVHLPGRVHLPDRVPLRVAGGAAAAQAATRRWPVHLPGLVSPPLRSGAPSRSPAARCLFFSFFFSKHLATPGAAQRRRRWRGRSHPPPRPAAAGAAAAAAHPHRAPVAGGGGWSPRPRAGADHPVPVDRAAAATAAVDGRTRQCWARGGAATRSVTPRGGGRAR